MSLFCLLRDLAGFHDAVPGMHAHVRSSSSTQALNRLCMATDSTLELPGQVDSAHRRTHLVQRLPAVQQLSQQHGQAVGMHIQHSGHSVQRRPGPELPGFRAQPLHHGGQPGPTPGLPAVRICAHSGIIQTALRLS